MSVLVTDERTALEDILSSCYGAIYAYGIVAAYLSDPNDAMTAIASYRVHRDHLLTKFLELGLTPPPARAAYTIDAEVTDEASARACASLLEENAVAHWANALFFLPKAIQHGESLFLQESATRAFGWSGISKAFSAAS